MEHSVESPKHAEVFSGLANGNFTFANESQYKLISFSTKFQWLNNDSYDVKIVDYH